MKRLLSLAIVFAMIVSTLFFPSLPVRADEGPNAYTYQRDVELIRWSMAMTAKMMGTAADMDIDADLAPILDTFKEIDFASPYNAFIAELPKEDAEAAADVVGADTLADIAPALASFINLQFGNFGARYDEVVSGLAAKDRVSAVPETFTLILLPYKEHIMAASIYGDSISSSFIISDQSTSKGLDADFIKKDAGDLNVKEITVRTYTPEDLDILFIPPAEEDEAEEPGEGLSYIEWGYTSGSASLIGDPASSSQDCMDLLFPFMAKSPRIPMKLCGNTISRYMNANKDKGLEASSKVSGDYLPLFESRGEDADIIASFFDISSNILNEQIENHEAPETQYSDSQIDPDAYYLFVVEKTWPDGDTLTGYDPFLESALPAKNIPEDPEDADYIIRVRVTWDGDTYVSGGHTVYYAYMHTSIYDAATGQEIKDLGTVEHRLSGVMMVSGSRTYMSPQREMIWDQVKPLFYPEEP